MSNLEKPAILGGTPVKTTPYGKGNRYGEEELKELGEALEQGTLFYVQGKKVRAMEAKAASTIGLKYAAAVSSGTASIHTALMALGISPGDEVVVSPITDMGSLIPILWQGAVPVFADVDEYTYCVTPETVEAVCTEKTRAVIAVHLWGNACDMDGLAKLCENKRISLIEDCAQAWGCTYKGKHVGTFGDIGCFSLNEYKQISCGDGGLVATDSEGMIRRLRLAADKAYNREPGAVMRAPAFLANNYRMNELQGAVALAQLDKLNGIVEKRRKLSNALTARLEKISGILPVKATDGCSPTWMSYLFRIDPDVLGIDAVKFADALKAEGIAAGSRYIGMCVYEYPIFAKHSAFERGEHPFSRMNYGKGLCPIAERVIDTIVHLPMNESHTEADIDETAAAIEKVAKWYAAAGK